MRIDGFAVEPVCQVLRGYGIQIAARTYRWWKTHLPSNRELLDTSIIELMRLLREQRDEQGRLPRERFYGVRKMHALLARHGYRVGLGKVARLMRLAGMKGLVKSRRIVTTTRSTPSAGDLVNRVFTARGPNQVWVTDMTYVRTLSGWVYVAFITDCYSRRIIAAHASCRMTEDLVATTLKLALEDRAMHAHPVHPGLIHHSDHGSQYTAIRYGEQLDNAGISLSFGSIGDAYDNALAEAVNSLYKTECVNQDGPFTSLGDVLNATLDWVHWWNTTRLHEFNNYQTPDETETLYYGTHQPLEPQRDTQ